MRFNMNVLVLKYHDFVFLNGDVFLVYRKEHVYHPMLLLFDDVEMTIVYDCVYHVYYVDDV